MDFAIIVEKNPDGSAQTLRSSVQPPPPEVSDNAKKLDATLGVEILKIEQKLIKAKLLDAGRPQKGAKKPTGNVSLWHALGAEFVRVCDEQAITGRRERRWLWE